MRVPEVCDWMAEVSGLCRICLREQLIGATGSRLDASVWGSGQQSVLTGH